MGSLVKWILGGIAGLVVLIIIAIVCIPLFVDPNDYKDRITQAVHEQTGRTLSIPGDIKLSVSPTLKAVFSLGMVNLSSSGEFEGTDFLSSELVDINLALWPLISSKMLSIDTIELKGVTVSLIKNKAGETNWGDLAGKEGKKPDPGKAAPAEEKKAGKALPTIDIGGIRIADINVTYADRQAGKTVKLSNFNLNLGHIMENRPFPFDGNFSLSVDDGKKPLTAATELKGNLAFDLARLLFTIDGLTMKTDITGAPVPVKLLGLEMTAKADLPGSTVDVSSLQVTVDETTIKGTASITNLQKPEYKAALHIDRLNLDRYKTGKKPAADAGTAAVEEKAAATAPAQPAAGQPRGAEENPVIIPVDLLRGLTFDTEVQIDSLTAAKLTSTGITIKATGKNGLVQLQPFSANLYNGTITVNGDIDARADMPTMKLTKVLQGVELGPLFMDLKGKEEVKGTADIKADITTIGLTKKQLTRNLNGTMSLGLTNGEIEKLKIIDTIRVAKRVYEAGTGSLASAASPQKSETGRPTSFADLSASGVIKDGVFRNDDLLAQSELMKVTGKGTVDLALEKIDYLLTIYLAKSLERDEDKDLVEMADTPIPYKVTGTFDRIEQSAALAEVLKAGAVKLLSKELEKQLGGEKTEDGTKKDSSGGAEELINRGLKSLFGK